MTGYTDYCTCFYDEATGQVYFYDEIEDQIIKKQKTKNKEEAESIMRNWVTNAPEHVICEMLED